MSYLTISTLKIGSKIIIRLRVPWNRLYNRSLTHSLNHFSVNWIIISCYSQIIFQFPMSVWVNWWVFASLDVIVTAFVTHNRIRIAFCTNLENSWWYHDKTISNFWNFWNFGFFWENLPCFQRKMFKFDSFFDSERFDNSILVHINNACCENICKSWHAIVFDNSLRFRW